MHLISKCTEIRAKIISFIHYTIYYYCRKFCIYSSLYETVHVAWIKIHTQSKYVILNVKNKFEKVVGSVLVYSLSLAF